MYKGSSPVKCAYLALMLFLSVACLWRTSDATPRRQLEGNAAVTRAQAVSSTIRLKVQGDHVQVVSPPDIATEEKMLGAGGTKMAAVRKLKAVNNGARSSNRLEGNDCGDSHVECNKESETPTSFTEGVDKSGFVAFNEDYHPPRHHPPKNN